MTICTQMRMITPWDLQIDTYYDALNPNGANAYPANASVVSSLTDLGKRGNTQAQGTGGLQPTYTRSAHNGFPAITFNGSQWMTCAASANNAHAGAMTILGIWQNTASGTQRLLMKLTSWAYSAIGAEYNFNIWVSGSGNAATTTGSPISSGVYQEYTANFNLGTNVTIYKNESLYQTITPFTSSPDVGIQGLFLGSRDGAQQYFSGAFQQLLIFFRQLAAWELPHMHLWTKVRGNL